MDQTDQAYAACYHARKAEHEGYVKRINRLVDRGAMKRREARQLIAVHAHETLLSQNQE